MRKKTIGSYLRVMRESKNLTQVEVAEPLGCTAQYISNVERDLCKPSPHHLAVWSKVVRANKREVLDLMIQDTVMMLKKELRL